MHPRGQIVHNDAVTGRGEVGFGNSRTDLEIWGLTATPRKSLSGKNSVLDLRPCFPNIWKTRDKNRSP